jgi:hypothetical protein
MTAVLLVTFQGRKQRGRFSFLSPGGEVLPQRLAGRFAQVDSPLLALTAAPRCPLRILVMVPG